jgi:hypothetical protein
MIITKYIPKFDFNIFYSAVCPLHAVSIDLPDIRLQASRSVRRRLFDHQTEHFLFLIGTVD